MSRAEAAADPVGAPEAARGAVEAHAGPEPGASPADAGAAAGALHRKLFWLSFFRLAIVTVLLGGTAVWTWDLSGEAEQIASRLYALVAATYAVSVVFALALRRRRALRAVAFGQIALDMALAAGVVALTGRAESVFVFMFSLGVVNGAILLLGTGAVAASALAVVTYLATVVLFAPHAPPALTLLTHCGAFVATGALAGYLAALLRDAGERLAEREGDLAAMTALHESIIQSVSSGLLTTDLAGGITFLNRAGEAMTGLELSRVRGQPARRWFSAFRRAAPRDETRIENSRGEVLRVGYTAFALTGRDGVPIGDAVIFQDLTALRQMEEEVRRGERLADLGRLAAGLAHELRNPLASITGSIELLRANAPRSEDARLMEIVLREAGRLEELLRRFLQFTRPASPLRAPVDLRRLAEETLEVFEHDPAAARVRVERDLAPATVVCDGDQLRQVLWNLLVNAAQALAGREAPADGPLGTVRVSCAPEPGGGAWLAVQDDGPGIARPDLLGIFTPFFTTKADGTGLGLAGAHRIVEAHGGTISVESEPGQGARFLVRLPADAPAGAAGVSE